MFSRADCLSLLVYFVAYVCFDWSDVNSYSVVCYCCVVIMNLSWFILESWRSEIQQRGVVPALVQALQSK